MGQGGIDNLLNVSKTALFAQTQAIRVISDNIANVNTPGYSRRKAELISQTAVGSGSLAVGTGVDVNRIVRIVDEFISRALFNRTSDRAYSEIKDELLSRAEAPFKVDGTGNIGFYLSEFFSSLEDLATNPSDVGLRQNVIEKGNNLTSSIKQSYSVISGLQREADDRIGVILQDVNRISGDIAQVNLDIQRSENTDQEALALRDKRDALIKEISEHVSVNVVESNDGSVLVSLANGFALVNGTSSNALNFTASPSYAPVGGYPLGLDGVALGHIVYDFDPTAGESHVNLTDVIAAGNGDLAGLLSFRGVQSTTDTSPFDTVGSSVEIASRIEALSRDLLTRFNQTYLGPVDETPGGVYNPSSGDLSGDPPEVYGLFSVAGLDDGDVLPLNGLPDDLNASISYSRLINFAISDPEHIAAAIDLDAVAGSTSFAPGDATNIQNLLALRDDSVAYSLGNFSGNYTIEQLYETTVTAVGSLAGSAKTSFDSAVAREEQAIALQQNVSGVSLDEEFANLINFQRAYEGSARMIRIADELLSEIIGLLG